MCVAVADRRASASQKSSSNNEEFRPTQNVALRSICFASDRVRSNANISTPYQSQHSATAATTVNFIDNALSLPSPPPPQQISSRPIIVGKINLRLYVPQRSNSAESDELGESTAVDTATVGLQ